ncbi:hypothetical protein ACFL2T_02930 [Elusimicrobiota bacterium]
MPLGLHAKISIEPVSIMRSRWVHDMANFFCRSKLQLEARIAKASAGL